MLKTLKFLYYLANYGKIVGQTDFFTLGLVIILEEGKL